MPLASAPNCRWVMKDPRRRAGPCPDLALPAHMFFRTPYSTIIRWLPCAVVVSALALALSGCGAATAPQAAEAAPPHDAPAQRITTGEREPMPVGNIPGWRQVFTDDFNGRTLDSSKWRLYWGKPGGDPAGWFDPRHVAVSHGMLVISAYRDRRDGGKWATGRPFEQSRTGSDLRQVPGSLPSGSRYRRGPCCAADARKQFLAPGD